MLFSLLLQFFIHCQADETVSKSSPHVMSYVTLDGIEYEDNTEQVLISVPDSTNTFIFSDKVRKVLNGTVSTGAFYNARNVVKSVSFSEKSPIEDIGENTFYGCVVLESVDMGNCKLLKKLRYSTFCNCRKLENLTLPPLLEVISSGCFYLCTSLPIVNIPPSVTTIEGYLNLQHRGSFMSCISLEKVNFLSTETEKPKIDKIGWLAFDTCEKLKTFTIPASCKNIALNNFLQTCNSLEEIIVEKENEVYEIIEGGLYRKSTKQLISFPNTKSAKLQIPEGCQIIGEVFRRNKIIEYCYVSSTVRVINSLAFDSAIKLTKIEFCYLNCSLTTIYNHAFYGTNLTELIIPKTVTTLSGGILINVPNCSASFEEGSTFTIDYQGLVYNSKDNSNLVIGFQNLKSYVLPSNLKTMGYACLSGQKELINISLPQSVEDLSFYTFADCPNLEYLTLEGNKIKVLNHNTFQYCFKFKGIIFKSCNPPFSTFEPVSFPSSSSTSEIALSQIGDRCFETCSSLQRFVFPSSIKSIGQYLFSSCTKLKEVIFMEGAQLNSLNSYAFFKTEILKKIQIPKSVISIEIDAFSQSSVEEITFETNSIIEVIGLSAFHLCSKLSKITFPENLKTLKGYSFHECQSLIDIRIPKSLETIERYAFYGCVKLENVIVDEVNSLKVIEAGSFRDCLSLKSFNLSSNHQYFTFEFPVIYNKNMSNLILYFPQSPNQTYTLNEKVTEILECAFENSVNLKEISIPNNGIIHSIGFRSFRNCKSLSELVLPESMKEIGSEAFLNTNITKCGTVKYPKDLYDKLIGAKIPNISLFECPPTKMFTLDLERRHLKLNAISFAFLMNFFLNE